MRWRRFLLFVRGISISHRTTMFFVHFVDHLVRLAPQLVCDKEALKHFFRSRTRPPHPSLQIPLCAAFPATCPTRWLVCVVCDHFVRSLQRLIHGPWLIYRYYLRNAVHQEKPMCLMNRGPKFVPHLGKNLPILSTERYPSLSHSAGVLE